MKDIEIVIFNDKSWVRLTEYQKLKEENERLKQQIEKMKCCSNCNGKFLSSRCSLCKDKSNWEIAE